MVRIPDRLQWVARMALLGFLLAATSFFSAITAMRYAIQGSEVVVPRITGLKAGDAQGLLSQKRLRMKIADRGYSSLPLDHVVRQSPPSGMRVKTGQRVHVVLSLGPQKVTVPALEGKSLRAARIELLRAGLQVGEVSACFLPGREPDVILQQNPPPQASDAGSPRVNVLVTLSQAETAYVMPDLAGLPLAEAQRRLGPTGVRVTKVEFRAGGDTPRGAVVSHTPSRGARVVSGTSVELLVAE